MNLVVIIAGIIILFMILYYALNSYFSNDTVFRIMPNTSSVIPATEINNGQSDAFTYVFLMRADKMVSDISYSIIDRQSEIKLYIENGSLKVSTYKIDASGNQTTDLRYPVQLMERFPFNRWVHVAVSVGPTKTEDSNKYTQHVDEDKYENGETRPNGYDEDVAKTDKNIQSILDLYIDGKLLKSVSIPYHKLYYRLWPLYDTALDPVVDIADDKPLTIGSPSDTESGYDNLINATISGMKRWDHTATVQEVSDEYNSTMRTRKLFGDYGLDLRLYNGSSLASRFSVI
jgi:hypothetical protein